MSDDFDQEIECLKRDNESLRAELEKIRKERDEATRDCYKLHMERWKDVCASEVFQELKHGKFRQVLLMLQDQQLSVGKAAESIAEIAHGCTPRLPDWKDEDTLRAKDKDELLSKLESAESRIGELEAALRRLVDDLYWALDVMEMYERRLLQFGDPKELVHSAVHVSRFSGARGAIELAWQVLNVNSDCKSCRDGNVPLEGWHYYRGGTHPDDEGKTPCSAAALLRGETK